MGKTEWEQNNNGKKCLFWSRTRNIHENESPLSKNMFFRRQQREKEFGEKIVFFNYETGSIFWEAV